MNFLDIFNLAKWLEWNKQEDITDKVELDFPEGAMWYRFSIVIHLLTTVLHIFEDYYSGIIPNFLLEILKIFVIPCQALNFILMATLYINAPRLSEFQGEDTEIQKSFKLWILIEMFMLMTIVSSNS